MTKLLIAALAVSAGLIHGQGKLKLSTKQLTPGDTVQLTGTEFAKKEPFTVLLVGAAGRTEMGEVKSDSAGKFTATLTVPAAVAPGSYRLVLEASDDDEAASANVVVMAGGTVAHVHADSAEHTEHTPTADPLELERARSPLVTGGVVLSIVVMLAAGGLLLRRNGQG
jgi:hypothetical protein